MTQSTRIYKHSAAGTDWAALALGAGLGLTLALQATTLRSGDFKDFYSVVVTVSRLAALVGTYLSVVGIFLVARIPVVERGVGHDRLVTWHRKLGPWSLYLIGAHVFLIVLGFAGQDQIPLYKEMWQFLTLYDWMWFALAGFVLMIMAGVTSYKKVRAKMSYETWWLVHILTYAAVAASFMHQIVNGSMFIDHPLNKAYWIGLYVVMALSIGYWRFWVPIWRSLKVNLRVEKVVVEGPGVISVVMKGRKLTELAAEGGQFFGWRFAAKGHFLMSHPYSLSAAPTEKHLRITVKDLGDHSRSVADLKSGTRVFMEGPYGAFRAGQAKKKRVVMIGGGIGVTPVRALLDEFKNSVRVDFIYRTSHIEDLALKAELDQIAAESGGLTKIHYMVGSRREYPMDAAHLLSVVPGVRDSDIYICGPKALVWAVVQAAEELGISHDRVHHEEFEFHKTVVNT